MASVAGDWTSARTEQDRLTRLFRIVTAADPATSFGSTRGVGAFKAALALLGVIAMLGSMEAMRGVPYSQQFMNFVMLVVSGLIAFWALRRYLFLLMRAEVVANQANCGDCGTYGRFTIDDVDGAPMQTRVCCMKCTHKWTISSEGA